MNFPLVINVINPKDKKMFKALLTEEGGRYCLSNIDSRDLPNTNLFISPGWIDLHAHIYDSFTSLGVPADTIGLKKGVHIVADAGSSGEATVKGFIKYIMPNCKTGIKIWLNISSIGLAQMREYSDTRLLKIEDTVKASLEYSPYVCGIKVRCSGLILEDKGIEPLKIAAQAARKAKLPLMVHIGEKPPEISEILTYLDKGDVITHCFHGKPGYPWQEDGSPIPELQQALERGVILDIGHGAASFSFEVCKKALQHKLPPISISTDLHIRNVNGPVYDLPTTMTKMMYCGMPLMDIIRGVTEVPAKVLRLCDWGDMDISVKNATIFEVRENTDKMIVKDSYGTELLPESVITPIAIISNYKLHLVNEIFNNL